MSGVCELHTYVYLYSIRFIWTLYVYIRICMYSKYICAYIHNSPNLYTHNTHANTQMYVHRHMNMQLCIDVFMYILYVFGVYYIHIHLIPCFCRWSTKSEGIVAKLGATRKKVLILDGHHIGKSFYYDGWMVVGVYAV